MKTPIARRRLFIVGAGDFGRELESHLGLVPEEGRDWDVVGFLDDNPNALKHFPSDLKIIGRLSNFPFAPGDLALVAVAAPATKRKLYEQLRGKVELMTFIAPDALIGKFTTLGEGCIVGPRVILGPNVHLEDGVFINSGSMLGHDVTVGAYTSLMANNNIAGHCKIGEEAFFASSITVIPARRICSGAFIGAGSVVISHVKEPRTVFGNPAKYL